MLMIKGKAGYSLIVEIDHFNRWYFPRYPETSFPTSNLRHPLAPTILSVAIPLQKLEGRWP